MSSHYFFVRARASGIWRTVDILESNGRKWGDKFLVRAGESGRWSVNHKPVEVERGLVVSFDNWADAEWFLGQTIPLEIDGKMIRVPRAELVHVEPESIVVFYEESDAMFHVRHGLGELMGQREVDQMMAEAAEAVARAEQEMGDAEAEDGEQGDSAREAGKKKRRARAKA
jgi:hypothetical protein